MVIAHDAPQQGDGSMNRIAKSSTVFLTLLTLCTAGVTIGQTIPVGWGEYQDLDLHNVLTDFVGNNTSNPNAIDLASNIGQTLMNCIGACHITHADEELQDQCISECIDDSLVGIGTILSLPAGLTLSLQCLDLDNDGQCDEGADGIHIVMNAHSFGIFGITENRAWSAVKAIYR